MPTPLDPRPIEDRGALVYIQLALLTGPDQECRRSQLQIERAGPTFGALSSLMTAIAAVPSDRQGIAAPIDIARTTSGLCATLSGAPSAATPAVIAATRGLDYENALVAWIQIRQLHRQLPFASNTSVDIVEQRIDRGESPLGSLDTP